MKELTTIERLIDRVVMPMAQPEQIDGLPYATHEGVINLGQHRLRVYRLNTGERIVNSEDVRNWINSVPMDEVTDGDSEFRRLLRAIGGHDQ